MSIHDRAQPEKQAAWKEFTVLQLTFEVGLQGRIEVCLGLQGVRGVCRLSSFAR